MNDFIIIPAWKRLYSGRLALPYAVYNIYHITPRPKGEEKMEYLVVAFFLGIIPAVIASKKGRSFLLWWFFGAMLFIVALPMAIFMKPLTNENLSGMRKCPKCAEYVQPDATICKHCKSELVPLTDKEKKLIKIKAKKENYVPGWLVLVTLGCVGVFIWFMATSGNSPTGSSPSKSVSSIFSSNYTVNVSGTPGLDFSGSYMVVTASGKSESKSVDGTVPQSYQLTGSIVSVSFQKKSEGGVLEVQILKDGRVVSASDTSAAYGVVTATTN